jgi:hypothetical protein
VRITCSVNYQDQNWGNNKGKVKLALMREGTEIAGENLFSEGAPRPYATRERILTHESVVEQAEPGDTFALYHVVGGGGGHEIHIKSFKITIELKPKAQVTKKDEAALNGADPKYQAISIYEPLDTGLMKANNLKAIKIAAFCSGPSYRAKIVLAEDADGNRRLYKSHGPQNATLTQMDLGEIQIRDFITSSQIEENEPDKAVHNLFLVSDLT